MLRDNLHCIYWWLRTPDQKLTIGRLHTDSEGSDYFLIVGDGDRFYCRDEVQPIAPVEQPATNKQRAPIQLSKLPVATSTERPACGDRVVSFKGWRVYRCGKCAACRVKGHRRLGTAARTTLAGG